MSAPPGTRPLSELDDVDWSSYRHAYGPADDVPRMIRTLAATVDAEAGLEAEHELWCAVLHQGQVGPVAVEALPFVLGILAGCSAPGQVLLANWLTDLSRVFDRDDDVDQQCRMAVEKAIDAVLDLLASAEPSVRSTAAGVLGSLPRTAPASWPRIRQRLMIEDESNVRSDLLVSLARLATFSRRLTDTTAVLAQAAQPPDPLEQCAAATGAFLLDPRNYVAKSYLGSLLPTGLRNDSWWGVGTPTVIVEQLTANKSWINDPDLFESVRSTTLVLRGFAFESVLSVLMDGLFPGGATDAPQFAADQDQRSRETFEMLQSVPALFRRYPVVEPTQMVMHRLLLPSDADRIRRWLDGADRRNCVAPGVVERFAEIFGRE